jgi:CubicO group peptidase (beta-lactamase class C family)
MPKPCDLPRNTPESMGVTSSALLDFVNEVEASDNELHSFMLLRHGQVIAEGWWAPYAAGHPHTLFSLTKSFTSTAVGLAIAEGRLSIEDPVLGFFPEDAPKRPSKNLRAMRVRHLLSMSTGHLADSTEKAVTNRQGNWVKGFFSMPVKHAPGAPFVYNSAASHVLSAIVQKVSGIPIKEYLTPRLFEPLGIEGMRWETDPRGINTGGWGLSLKTEDIARFGQMYLQKGVWEGQRILPEPWVERATSKQVRNDLDPESPFDWKQGYGFQFWRCQYNAYRADGAFGQFCIVMPDQDAVLAITSGVANMQSVLTLVWKHILPAMGSAPLPVDTATQRKLSTRLADLCLDPPQGNGAPGWVGQRSYRLEDNPFEAGSVRMVSAGDHFHLTFEGRTGQHSLKCGRRSWMTDHSSFFPIDRLHGSSTPPEGYPVAAACAWTAEDTLEIQARFYETPFCFTTICQFEREQVTIQNRVNVSFGPTELTTLAGHLA